MTVGKRFFENVIGKGDVGICLIYINPLTLSHNKPWFLCVCRTSLLKTLWEKEKLLIEQFLLYLQCFLPFRRPFHHFHQTLSCHQQTLSLRKSLNFVVWERVDGQHCVSITLGKKLCENTEGMKMPVTSILSFSPQCFLPFWTQIENFLAVCNLMSSKRFRQVHKFVISDRETSSP